MKQFATLREKTYSYLTENNNKDKKGTRKCFIKRKLKFQDCKNCLSVTQLGNETIHLEK